MTTEERNKKALALHAEHRGKYAIRPLVPVETGEDLSLAYTPGVATPCLEIAKDPGMAYTYTRKWNTVAVVTDGTAVLGLGDIGPLAGLPVMEGKAILFRQFGGIDAIPICLDTKDPEEIIRTVKLLAPSFGGINLEDISAPRCFYIEERLKEELDIPVFHDDQHGTAIAVTAALINALKVTGREIGGIRAVINGAGSAGIATGRLLKEAGVEDLVMVDRCGILCPGTEGMNPAQAETAAATNPRRITGGLAEALRGADVFIGVSAPGLVNREMVAAMAKAPIVFAMANPDPEILPEEALAGGAAVVGTGRSDYPNQINNVMVFPGLFRGALDARAGKISREMMMAAAYAIAALEPEGGLGADRILPRAFDPRLPAAVAAAVKEAARRGGAAGIQ